MNLCIKVDPATGSLMIGAGVLKITNFLLKINEFSAENDGLCAGIDGFLC